MSDTGSHSKLTELLKNLREELSKGKIVSQARQLPQMPAKPEPVKAKPIDKEARLAQMAADPNMPPQRRASTLAAEKAAASEKAAAANARQDKEYHSKLDKYHKDIKHWPLMVIHGDSLDTSGSRGGASVEGKKYRVTRTSPEHMNQEDVSHEEDAHNENPFRVKDGRTHRLTVRLQGGGPIKQVWVTPEQYKSAMMTGWHVHDFKDEE